MNNQAKEFNFEDIPAEFDQQEAPKTEETTFASVPVFDKPRRKKDGYDKEQVDRYIKAAGKAFDEMATYCNSIENDRAAISKAIVEAEIAAQKIIEKAEEEARFLLERTKAGAQGTIARKNSFEYVSEGGDD